jgi:hypothetical protein
MVMLPVNARTLLNRLEVGRSPRLATLLPLMDENARRISGIPKGAATRIAGDAAVSKALERDVMAFDPKTRQLVGTESHVAIDRTVRPVDQSAIFDKGIVEQCMEFVMRYTRTLRAKFGKPDGGFGADWTMQYNIADDVRNIADGKLTKPGYTAYHNGGTVPPRAGDVLSLESEVLQTLSPPRRRFHVALISDVYHNGRNWFAKVYEANVPFHVNEADISKHFTDIPLHIKDGKFTLGRVHTSQKGYGIDMEPVGWIHPLADKALPGAEANAGLLGGRTA